MNSAIIQQAGNSAKAPVKVPVLAVKFWYERYDPELAFDLFEAPHVPLEAKSTDPLFRQWRPARAGATLESVLEYMQEHVLRILASERIGQRRRGRWEGLYLVTIGREMARTDTDTTRTGTDTTRTGTERSLRQ